MFKILKLSAIYIPLLLLVSCLDTYSNQKTGSTGVFNPKYPISNESLQLTSDLESFDTCQEVHAHLKKIAAETLEQNKNWQKDFVKLNHRNQERRVSSNKSAQNSAVNESSTASDTASESSGGPEDYTSTNNQVEGIEESDFIKNTGTHIYQISGNKVHIVQSWPANDMKLLFSLDVDGLPYKLLLSGENQLIVLAYAPTASDQVQNEWGYYNHNRNKTLVHLINVSDKTSPIVEHSYEIMGTISHARRMGSSLKLISSQYYNYLPSHIFDSYTILYNYGLSLEEKLAKIEEAYAKNLATIESLPLDNWFKKLNLARKTGDTDPELNDEICKKIHSPQFSTQNGLTRIVTIDTQNLSIDEEFLLSYVQDLYMSSENLYLLTPYYNWWHSSGSSKTYIHKFSVASDNKVAYLGSGEVVGTPINQFALDEHEGNLRIATTVNENIVETFEENGVSYSKFVRRESYNKVFVLDQEDKKLTVIGETDKLAENERIYSVRYKGPWAYMVTFRQIDPLFTINLEEATNPHVVGELKIPGFSSYIHFLDDNHLLTVGRGGDMEGRISGLKISVFDVTDKKNPVESAGFTIDGDGWEWSEALFDHKAFTFFPSKNLLAIPVSGYDSSAYFSKLVILDIAHDAVVQRGSVDVGQAENDPKVSYWRYPFFQRINRSIFADNFVYAISQGGIASASLDLLDSPLSKVSYPCNEQCYRYYGY